MRMEDLSMPCIFLSSLCSTGYDVGQGTVEYAGCLRRNSQYLYDSGHSYGFGCSAVNERFEK